MNTPSRRQRIEQMLQDDPQDALLRYSLAMEQDKEGDHEQSLAGLRELMRDDPPYVASFFMAAKQLTRLRRVDEARTALRDGIEAARQQSDSHAVSEMSEMLMNLGALGE